MSERERIKIILKQAMASFHDGCVSDDEGRCWHEHDDYEGHLASALLAARQARTETAVEAMEARVEAAERRVEEAEAHLATVRQALVGAPMERLDTHGWIECVWCHATRDKHAAGPMVHRPDCGCLTLRAALRALPRDAAAG